MKCTKTISWGMAGMLLAAGLVSGGVAPALGAPATAVAQVQGPATLAVQRPAAKTKTVKSTRTTETLNLRQKPGTQYKSLALLKKGTLVVPTGKTSGMWWQIKAGTRTGWASSRYLKTSAVTVAPAKPAATPVAGADRWVDGTQPIYAKASLSSQRLMAQTGGTKVKRLKTSGKWAYVQAPTGKGWILNASLVASAAKASGNSTTHRWTTTATNVRKGASVNTTSLGVLPANQKVGFLKTANGWSQVATAKGTGWIKNTLLTNIEYRPARPLQPMTRSLIRDIEKRFGAGLGAVGGSRSGSNGHGSGLAADFMIKQYSTPSGIAAGDKMAAYMVANHEKLGINYLIWRDKLWLADDGQWGPYSKGGWGKHLEMSRGWNTTTRHMDHIHAEIRASRAAR